MDWTCRHGSVKSVVQLRGERRECFRPLYEVRCWGLSLVRTSAVRGGVFLSVGLHASLDRLSCRSCSTYAGYT
jgi:hypothetical protein